MSAGSAVAHKHLSRLPARWTELAVELLESPERAWEIRREQAQALLPPLTAVVAALLSRAATPDAPEAPKPPIRAFSQPAGERWLGVADLAQKLGLTTKQVYRRAQAWPFTYRDGKRLSFRESEVDEWMEHHRVNEP